MRKDPYSGLSQANDLAPITTCADGTFCCGLEGSSAGTACCSEGAGVHLENGKIEASASTDSSSSTSSTFSSSHSSLPTSSRLKPATSTPGSYPAAPISTISPTSTPLTTPQAHVAPVNIVGIVGGAVGGAAAIVVILLGFYYFMIRRKERRHIQPQGSHPLMSFHLPNVSHQQWKEVHEAPTYESEVNRSELAAVPVTRSELEGWQDRSSSK